MYGEVYAIVIQLTEKHVWNYWYDTYKESIMVFASSEEAITAWQRNGKPDYGFRVVKLTPDDVI